MNSLLKMPNDLFHKGFICTYLKNIFDSSELQQNSVIRRFRITAADDKNYNAKSEFEKYRIIQNLLIESDFDRETKTLEGYLPET